LAYREFLAHGGLTGKIHDALAVLDVDDVVALARTGAQIRSGHGLAFQPALNEAVEAAYAKLVAEYGTAVSWAVRSSATAEDLPDASFAGQQETFLNVHGLDNVKKRMHEVFASLFNDRAIAYRVHQGFDTAWSRCLRRAEDDPLGHWRQRRGLHARHGVGLPRRRLHHRELRPGRDGRPRAGQSRPVLRPQADLRAGRPAILRRNVGGKAIMMIYDETQGAERPVRVIEVPEEDRQRFCMTDGRSRSWRARP